MKREALKKMGLTDEQVNSIMETNGHDIEAAKGEVATTQQENETLKSQLATRDKDMKDLKKQVGDNEALTKQVSDLQTKYNDDTKNLTAQLTQTKLNGALDSALTSAKARNHKAVRGLLDMDKLVLDDNGVLTGLDDQLATLKKSDAYLFDEGKQPHYDPQGGAGSNDNNATQDLVNAFKQ